LAARKDCCERQTLPADHEANGSGVVWAVLNPLYSGCDAGSLRRKWDMFPKRETRRTDARNMIIQRGREAAASKESSRRCAESTGGCEHALAVVQAGFLYKRYQAQKGESDLAAMLDQARVTPAGDR